MASEDRRTERILEFVIKEGTRWNQERTFLIIGHFGDAISGQRRFLRCTDQVTRREYLLKEIPLEDDADNEEETSSRRPGSASARSESLMSSAASRWQKDLHTWSQLRHPHILRYEDAWQTDDVQFVLSESALMSLTNLLEKMQHQKIHLDLVPIWLYHIASALNYMHEHNLDQPVLYRNLHPDNVLVTDRCVLKLCHFDAAKRLDKKQSTTQTVVGTGVFQSPEIQKGLPYDKATDIWCFGVTAVCITNYDRFRKSHSVDKLKRIISESGHDPELIRTIVQTLQDKPLKRPAASVLLSQLCKHWGENSLQAEIAAELYPEPLIHLRAGPPADKLRGTKHCSDPVRVPMDKDIIIEKRDVRSEKPTSNQKKQHEPIIVSDSAASKKLLCLESQSQTNKEKLQQQQSRPQAKVTSAGSSRPHRSNLEEIMQTSKSASLRKQSQQEDPHDSSFEEEEKERYNDCEQHPSIGPSENLSSEERESIDTESELAVTASAATQTSLIRQRRPTKIVVLGLRKRPRGPKNEDPKGASVALVTSYHRERALGPDHEAEGNDDFQRSAVDREDRSRSSASFLRISGETSDDIKSSEPEVLRSAPRTREPRSRLSGGLGKEELSKIAEVLNVRRSAMPSADTIDSGNATRSSNNSSNSGSVGRKKNEQFKDSTETTSGLGDSLPLLSERTGDGSVHVTRNSSSSKSNNRADDSLRREPSSSNAPRVPVFLKVPLAVQPPIAEEVGRRSLGSSFSSSSSSSVSLELRMGPEMIQVQSSEEAQPYSTPSLPQEMLDGDPAKQLQWLNKDKGKTGKENLLASYSKTSGTQTDRGNEQSAYSFILPPLFSDSWQCSTEFTSSGGTLQKPGSQVILRVPPGAVSIDHAVAVHSAVCADVERISGVLQLDDGEIVASPLAEFEVSIQECALMEEAARREATADRQSDAEKGYHFRKPVQVLLPTAFPQTLSSSSSALLNTIKVYRVSRSRTTGEMNITRLRPKTSSKVSAVATESEGDELTAGINPRPQSGSKKPVRTATSPWDDSATFLLTADGKILVTARHFCGYVCTYCQLVHSGPIMLHVLAAGDHRLKSGNRHAARVHVHIWDDRLQITDFRQHYGIANLQELDSTSLSLTEELTGSKLKLSLRVAGEEESRYWRHCKVSDGSLGLPEEREFKIDKVLRCSNTGCHAGNARGRPLSVKWMLESSPDSPQDLWFQCVVDIKHIPSVIVDSQAAKSPVSLEGNLTVSMPGEAAFKDNRQSRVGALKDDYGIDYQENNWESSEPRCLPPYANQVHGDRNQQPWKDLSGFPDKRDSRGGRSNPRINIRADSRTLALPKPNNLVREWLNNQQPDHSVFADHPDNFDCDPESSRHSELQAISPPYVERREASGRGGGGAGGAIAAAAAAEHDEEAYPRGTPCEHDDDDLQNAPNLSTGQSLLKDIREHLKEDHRRFRDSAPNMQQAIPAEYNIPSHNSSQAVRRSRIPTSQNQANSTPGPCNISPRTGRFTHNTEARTSQDAASKCQYPHQTQNDSTHASNNLNSHSNRPTRSAQVANNVLPSRRNGDVT